MKVLVFSSGSYKSILALRVVALAQHLGRLGNEVTIMAPSADKYNNFTPDENPKLPHVKVVQPWQLVTHSAMVNLLPYLISSFVALMRHRVDVIYLCKPTPITILGLLPKLFLGTPVILDLDDLGSDVMKSQGQSAFQYTLVAWCEKLAMRYADGVVVASTYLEKNVRRQYPNKETVVIPNGVEPDDYVVNQKTQPRKAIYYYGAVNRIVLIESLLRSLPEVIQAMPDTIVTIVGGGDALPEAKRIVEELGLEASVSFTGWIEFLDIQRYVQPGDIAVCYQPNTKTVKAASNMKVFQYMAMSTVPVVSAVGDLPMYVHDGKIGRVVSSESVSALAETFIELLKDGKGRMSIAKRARKAAETEYSWATRTQRLDEFMHAFVRKEPS